ncbi:MAG: MHS family MFS transporter [Armatimonadetes bacterium]|nr:MHS family MFS transporter [Armatimonadota bacterium]
MPSPAMTADEKRGLSRVIAASSAGTLIEWYDFYIFGSLAATFGAHFFPSNGDETAALLKAFATFAVGFVVRPFGAFFFGRLGDLVGRKYTFLLTLLLMGGSTFAIGILPTYGQIGVAATALLVLLRAVQGLALGGEYGGAATYVAEHSPVGRRGFYTSFIQTTATLGLFVSIIVILLCRNAVGKDAFEDWGWRIPFLLSSVLVVFSYLIRRNMEESPEFAEMKAGGKTSKNPLKEAFGNTENLRWVLLALFGATAGQGVVWYTAQFYALSFMQDTLKVDKGVAGTVMLVALALATPFFILFGSLSDRVGRKKVMMAGMVLGAVGFIPMFNLLTVAAGYDAATKSSSNPNVPMLVAVVFVMVLFVTMVYGPIAAFLIELFPTRIRYTSMSVPYHIGNGIFGGLVPFVSTALVASSGNLFAGLWYPVGVAAATFVIGSLFLKEREHETTDPLPG